MRDRRGTTAARAFFARAPAAVDGLPVRVTSDKVTCYLPALRTLLPAVEHRSDKSLHNGW